MSQAVSDVVTAVKMTPESNSYVLGGNLGISDVLIGSALGIAGGWTMDSWRVRSLQSPTDALNLAMVNPYDGPCFGWSGWVRDRDTSPTKL